MVLALLLAPFRTAAFPLAATSPERTPSSWYRGATNGSTSDLPLRQEQVACYSSVESGASRAPSGARARFIGSGGSASLHHRLPSGRPVRGSRQDREPR